MPQRSAPARQTTHPTRRRRVAGVLTLALFGGFLPFAAAAPAMAATNVAPSATVTASSEDKGAGSTAVKAVDGSILGYPQDETKEWSSNAGKAGSWLQLAWAKPITTSQVILYDRPNSNDQVTGANLVFSDGTKVPTGSLNNNGSATTVNFPAVTTTTLRVEITQVSSRTENIGLAEIQVMGDNAENSAPVANAGADVTVGAGSGVTLDGSKSTDPDGDSLTYAWTQVGTSPAAVTLTGDSTVKPTFTPTDLGTYTFSLVVSDGKLQSAADEVQVTVTDAPPVSSNLANKATVTASTEDKSSGSTAIKAVDGSILGYPKDETKEWTTLGGKAGSWLQLTWPAPIKVDKVVLYDRPNTNDRITSGKLVFSDGSSVDTGSLNNNGTATTITFPARTTTSVRLNITGVSSATENIGLAEIEVWGYQAANRGPVANAGADATGLTGAPIPLDGSASSDPDGDTLTYQWTQQDNGAPAATITNPTAAKASFQTPTAGEYLFTLTVSDGKLTASDDITVQVAQNQAPTANAGADQDGLTGKTITLDGSASSDPDGNDTLKYKWTQVGTTPATVSLTGADTAKPTFVPRTAGKYTFKLEVSDGANQATDEVVVTVAQAPNTAPVANAGAAQTVAVGTPVTLDGSASSDPDGDALTYSWALTGGTGLTLTNPKTAQPTFTPIATGEFKFTLTVDDGQTSSTADVVVTVKSAGALTVANSGTKAVWKADFGKTNSGKTVTLQKQTIVTKMTTEVTAASWVTVTTAKANSSGVATFTINDPLEVAHNYRAVINPTSSSPVVSDVVNYAAPRPTMDTGLANVYIDTNEGGTINSKDVYWEGRMTMTAATKAAGTTDVACGAVDNALLKVAGRGNYTWTLDKKPYKFSLDKKANLCGMGSAKKWALVANHYDRSLLRNTVAMEMGQGLSNLAYTPDSVPVNVYVNGSYQGSYTLMERVNIGDGRVANGANELKDNTGGVNDAAPNVTGTYLLEWDFRAGGDHNITVGESGIVAINEPEDEDDGSGITPAQIKYISDFVNEADVAVFANNFADPNNGWRKYIDEKSFIDWYLVQELTKNLDSNMYTSVNMYKTRDTVVNGVTVPGKLYFGPLWDFDTAMGSANYPGNQGKTSGWYLRNENSAIGAKMTTETWINRLFQDPTLAAAVKARWKEVYPTLQQSDAFVSAQSSIISSSASANFQKWSVTERLETEQVIKGSWSSEVSYLRTWLKDRITWMNKNI